MKSEITFDATGSISEIYDKDSIVTTHKSEIEKENSFVRSMPSKLTFNILHTSGEDPDYPSTELLVQNSETKGWQSPKFGKYPYKLIFELENVSIIKQIQILSHEYKISKKIEVYIGKIIDPDSGKIQWNRLGHMEFDTNKRSNYVGRELKCAHVENKEAEGKLILLLVHECHINELNTYNQVGIVAISILGNFEESVVLESTMSKIYQLSNKNYNDNSAYCGNGNNYNNSNCSVKSFESNSNSINLIQQNILKYDSVTAEQIKELQKLKEIAVSNEDYDRAKELKVELNQLMNLGDKIVQLESQKQAAVRIEDYDTAKAIKVEIEKIRLQYKSKTQQSNNTKLIKESKSLVKNEEIKYNVKKEIERSEEQEILDIKSEIENPYIISNIINRTKHQEYDDRPAQGKGNYFTNEDSKIEMIKDNEMIKDIENEINIPEGFPSDLPGPEEIPMIKRTEAEYMIENIGEYITKCYYSKNWQLRDAALKYIMEQLNEITDSHLFKLYVDIGSNALNDKIANVFHTGITFIHKLIKTCDLNILIKDLQGAIHSYLIILIEKIGNSNIRIRDVSMDLILTMAKLKVI